MLYIMFEIVNMGESHECYTSKTIEQLSRQMSFYYCLSEPLELNIQFLTNHTFSILIKREHSIQIETCFSAKNKPEKHTSFSDLGHGEFARLLPLLYTKSCSVSWLLSWETCIKNKFNSEINNQNGKQFLTMLTWKFSSIICNCKDWNYFPAL